MVGVIETRLDYIYCYIGKFGTDDLANIERLLTSSYFVAPPQNDHQSLFPVTTPNTSLLYKTEPTT